MADNRPDLVGLACPKCSGTRSRVVETRAHENRQFRKRLCVSCKVHYWTAETNVEAPSYFKGRG